MALLSPFKALRYDPSRVGDLGKVTAPPYDIIAPMEQDALYARHPCNIVRLDFGKALPGDGPRRNKYLRAAERLAQWRDDGTLKRDPLPALYLATQTYTAPDGRKRSFAGVYALLKLEPYAKGVVRPHERTLSKPKADRLELTRATRTNFSPIFLLHQDPGGRALRWMAARMRRKPAADFTTDDGQRHRLWVVDDPAAVRAYTQSLEKSPVYIADGHHRYETMLAYAREAPRQAKAAAAHTLVCLTPFGQPGLIILPTHRLIHGLKGLRPDKLLQDLAASFTVEALPGLPPLQKRLARAHAAGTHAFGLVLPGAFHLLTLKPGLDPLKAVAGRRSAAYKRLDVSLLQALVLEGLLGMSQESIAAQENLLFEKDAAKAAEAVAAGSAQAAFLVNPTRMEELKAVSDAKDVMPQKSTYFQPKLVTGAVLRPLD